MKIGFSLLKLSSEPAGRENTLSFYQSLTFSHGVNFLIFLDSKQLGAGFVCGEKRTWSPAPSVPRGFPSGVPLLWHQAGPGQQVCSVGLEQGHRYSLRRGDSVCFSSFNQNRRNWLVGSYHQPFSSHNTVSLGTSVAKDGTESSERGESWSAAAWLGLALQEFMTLTFSFSHFLQKPG